MSGGKMFRFKYMIAVSAVFLFHIADARAQEPSAVEIVKKLDELYRSESSYAEFEMEITTPHWERTLRMNAWTEGMEKTFIRILSPAKEKGVSTLRIEDEMWNYLPKTDKVMKIPPSMMMSSWMGSDFNNNDIVAEYTYLDDFHFKLITPEDAVDSLLYVESIPKEGVPIVWGKVVTAVRRTDYIPVWEKYYDDDGKLMRVMNFEDIEEFDGKVIPSVMELIPQNEEGHRTVVRYLDVDFNPNMSEDVFSLRNLRSRN
jgi:outer membrane lipoprotein-sorting protein